MILQKMTDFVLNQNEINGQDHYGYEETAVKCIKYANLLKQPLMLGMFVPTDDEGNVLKEPEIDFDGTNQIHQIKYERAKEKVLFKHATYRVTDGKVHKTTIGNLRLFEKAESVANKWVLPNHKLKTIEDLLQSEHEIELTESALKQIFGDA